MSIFKLPDRPNFVRFQIRLSQTVLYQDRHWMALAHDGLGFLLRAEGEPDMQWFLSETELLEALEIGTAKMTVRNHTGDNQ